MIKTFAHKGLSRLHATDDHRGVKADHADKLRRILARLDASAVLADMDLPGYRLHGLRGNLAGFHAVMVNGNWRVIFRLFEGHAFDVDYVDYH